MDIYLLLLNVYAKNALFDIRHKEILITAGYLHHLISTCWENVGTFAQISAIFIYNMATNEIGDVIFAFLKRNSILSSILLICHAQF